MVLAVCATLVGLTAKDVARAETHWVLTDLGAGVAVDINEHGQIVGESSTASGRGRAVLWTLQPGT